MATFQLIHGATTIDLDSTSGLQWLKDGIATAKISSLTGPARVAETYKLKVTSTSHDAAATTLQNLVKVLKACEDYRTSIWQTKPVYLKVQTTNETNPRYAMVEKVEALAPPESLGQAFDDNNVLLDLQIDVMREHPWRSAVPGTLGSAQTLGASDGPASPTMVHLANFRDDGNLTHVWHYDDSATTFSSNLLSATNGTALFPASPAVNDYLVFGSTDIAFKHICLNIATAGSFSWTPVVQYYNGSWQTMTLGTHYTVFQPGGGELTALTSIFKKTGLWSINVFPPSDWTTLSLNSQTVYGIRILLSAVTSTTTLPTKNGDTIYSQRSNYFEVPAAVIGGDLPPTLAFRLWAPSGGDQTAGPANLSRIIMGAKSRGIDDSDEQFCFSLNAGGADNPAAWATAAGTDGSLDADVQAPGGMRCTVDFSTDTTSVARVTLTGTGVLSNWWGEYRPMIRVQQVGGAAGDCSVSLRAFIGNSNVYDTHYDSIEQATRGADDGPEVLTFPLLALPFSRVYNADSVTSEDVIFQIFASRSTGSSSLRIYDLILVPVDEGSVGMDDALLDSSNGSGALRGGTLIDLDAGLIADRTQKHLVDASGNIKPASPWARVDRPIPFANLATKHRVYCLMLSYSSTGGWGAEPLTANPGQHLAVEVFAHTRFALLRGGA